MYDDTNIGKVTKQVQSDMRELWLLLLQKYKEHNLIVHKNCSHTEVEAKTINFKEMIKDFANISYFDDLDNSAFQQFSHSDTIIQFIGGISMLPDLKPADIVIIEIFKDDEKIRKSLRKDDYILGRDITTGTTSLHKLMEIGEGDTDRCFTKGNSNTVPDVLSKYTIVGKVISKIERESDFWWKLVQSKKMKGDCIEYLNHSLDCGCPNEEEEHIKNLIKKVEGLTE